MNACAWCGARTGLRRTTPLDGSDPIWLCLNRDGCRRAAEAKTIYQLSKGA